MWEESGVNRLRAHPEQTVRKALSEAMDPRKAAAIAAAGTAAAAAGIGWRRLRDGDRATFDSDAYRLLAREPVGTGIKRLLAAQVDDALAQLRGKAGTELQFAAISLGERIYAEKPKRFTKRLEKRWEAWRERKPVVA